MAFDPATAGQKWSQNLARAASDGTIQKGVEAVTTDPGALAARQKAVWLANLNASADTWARNVQTGLGNWQSKFTAKLANIGTGATQGQDKMTAFLAKLSPVIDGAVRSLPPRGTYEQNKARAMAMMDALHKVKGSLKVQ